MTRAALILLLSVPWSYPFTVVIAFAAGLTLGIMACVGGCTV
jgi:hypothetical protein